MNAALGRVTPNITTMIRMDHTHVMAAFHRYKADISPARKQALVRHACLALEVHAQLEEEIFYPAMRTVMTGDEVLEKSEPEHNQMRELIAALRDQTTVDQSYDENFFALMRIVIHHVADEETRLLPAAERLLGDQLGQLGLEMTKRRLQLLKPRTGEIASTAVLAFPVGAAAFAAGALAIGAMMFSQSRGRSSRARAPWRR
jgi:hemerythrin superfamily protein